MLDLHCVFHAALMCGRLKLNTLGPTEHLIHDSDMVIRRLNSATLVVTRWFLVPFSSSYVSFRRQVRLASVTPNTF